MRRVIPFRSLLRLIYPYRTVQTDAQVVTIPVPDVGIRADRAAAHCFPEAQTHAAGILIRCVIQRKIRLLPCAAQHQVKAACPIALHRKIEIDRRRHRRSQLVFHYKIVAVFFAERLHLPDLVLRSRAVFRREITVVIHAHRHSVTRGHIRPALLRIQQGSAVLQQDRPLPVPRYKKRHTDHTVRVVLRIRIRIVRRRIAGVPQQPGLPLGKEGLRRAQAAGKPGVLGRADPVGRHAVGLQRIQMRLQLIRFTLCRGIGRRIVVHPHIHLVVNKIGKLRRQFLPIGEVRAVDRIR